MGSNAHRTLKRRPFGSLGGRSCKTRFYVDERREIDQFRINLHPRGLAVRPEVSDRLGLVHVVERACARHLDAGHRLFSS